MALAARLSQITGAPVSSAHASNLQQKFLQQVCHISFHHDIQDVIVV